MGKSAQRLPELISLWEAAHRWHGEPPEAADPWSLSEEVRGTLQRLASAATSWGDPLPICDRHGRRWTERPRSDVEMPLNPRLAEHLKSAGLGLHDGRPFETLREVFVRQADLRAWCEANGFAPPTFCLSQEQNAEKRPARKNEHEDKIRVQAVAQTLWHLDPNFTSTDIIRHPGITRFANGAQYTEDTRRRWIREVDPRPPQERRGRPRKQS